MESLFQQGGKEELSERKKKVFLKQTFVRKKF